MERKKRRKKGVNSWCLILTNNVCPAQVSLFPSFILFVLSTCFIGEYLRTGALESDSLWFEYQLQLLSNLAKKLNISVPPFPPLLNGDHNSSPTIGYCEGQMVCHRVCSKESAQWWPWTHIPLTKELLLLCSSFSVLINFIPFTLWSLVASLSGYFLRPLLIVGLEPVASSHLVQQAAGAHELPQMDGLILVWKCWVVAWARQGMVPPGW